MLFFKHLMVASLLVSSSLAQEITQESEQKSVVKSEKTENSEEIKRQGPQQAGWGGLISGKFFFLHTHMVSSFVNFVKNIRKSPSIIIGLNVA